MAKEIHPMKRLGKWCIALLSVALVFVALVLYFAFPAGKSSLTLLWSTDAQGENVRNLAFSLNGKFIVACSINKVVIWDRTKNNEVVFSEPELNPSCVALSPDGLEFGIGTYQGPIVIVDLKTLRRKMTLKFHDGIVESIAYSPDGKELVSGGSDRFVVQWRIEKKEILRKFVGHFGSVNSVAFSPDKKLIVSGGSDNQIIVWDIGKGNIQTTLKYHTHKILSVGFSPDGNQIISGGRDKTVFIYDLANKKGRSFDFGRNIYCVGFSPTGKMFSASGGDMLTLDRYQPGTITIWSSTNGKEIVSFSRAHSKWVRSFSFNPKNEMEIATGGYDYFVKVWKIEGEN